MGEEPGGETVDGAVAFAEEADGTEEAVQGPRQGFDDQWARCVDEDEGFDFIAHVDELADCLVGDDPAGGPASDVIWPLWLPSFDLLDELGRDADDAAHVLLGCLAVRGGEAPNGDLRIDLVEEDVRGRCTATVRNKPEALFGRLGRALKEDGAGETLGEEGFLDL